MGIWPFARSSVREKADKLLEAVQVAARRPEFFGVGRVGDTLDGRFELMTLFASLALIRLRDDPSAGPLAQSFTDTFFSSLDAGLREFGVGDLTVPKRMRVLAGSFYGRLDAYAGAIAAGDKAALTAALARNIVASTDFASSLASLVLATAERQAALPADALIVADSWSAPSS